MTNRTTRRGGRFGFTLFELLLVLTIIGILATLVSSSIKGAIRASRIRRADALCRLVQEGLATYYAQNDKWPGKVGEQIENGTFYPGKSSVRLSESEARDMIRVLVSETKKGNPLLDITGMFVSRDTGGGYAKHGLNFMDAIRGTKRNRKKMKVAQMHFGYPEPAHGHFRPFKIIYNVASDHMEVKTQ